MITLDQLIGKYNNKFVEVTGGPLWQCVDAANIYIRDVLGQPIIPFTNAVDFPDRVDKTKYDFILNGATNFPLKGDIVIWKPTPGHIAVCFEGDANRFCSWDQNFPVGSSCHLQEHSYINVVGWLRLKGTTSSDCSVEKAKIVQLEADKASLDAQKRDYENKYNTAQVLATALQSKIN